jgi:hypothetical protein
LKIEKGGRDEAQVSEVTSSQKIIRHVVNIKDHVCTCREWQVSGKPCAHALALIITYRNAKMEDYLDPYYSVYHFRQTYGGVIKPLPDKSQWLRIHGFKVMPPLDKRNVGRVRKKRIPSCLENKGNKPRGKACGRLSVQTAVNLAIGLTLQSALEMEQRRGKCVCLFNAYLLNFFYSSQFSCTEKVEQRQGRLGGLLVQPKVNVMQLLVHPKGRSL